MTRYRQIIGRYRQIYSLKRQIIGIYRHIIKQRRVAAMATRFKIIYFSISACHRLYRGKET